MITMKYVILRNDITAKQRL